MERLTTYIYIYVYIKQLLYFLLVSNISALISRLVTSFFLWEKYTFGAYSHKIGHDRNSLQALIYTLPQIFRNELAAVIQGHKNKVATFLLFLAQVYHQLMFRVVSWIQWRKSLWPVFMISKSCTFYSTCRRKTIDITWQVLCNDKTHR